MVQAFNDCRCEKCNAKVRWFGELIKPPACTKCGHVSDYNGIEKKLQETRDAIEEIDRLEKLAKTEQNYGHVNGAQDLCRKAKKLREQYGIH